MPLSGWRDSILRAVRQISDDNLNLIAAGTAFYWFLTIIPLLGSIILIYGLAASPELVVQNVQSLSRMMPAEVASVVGEQLQRIVTSNQDKKGFGLLVALAVALYGSTKGSGALVTALNIVYDEEETRGFLRRNGVILGISVGLLLLFIVLIAASSALAAVEAFVGNLPLAVIWTVRVAGWLLMAGIVAIAIAAVYRYAPDRDDARWQWLTPGSILATVAIVVISVLFGLYLSTFGNYEAAYGSVAGIIILLTWLNITAYALLFGGEVNAELERQTVKDTTRGSPKPLGARKAEAADTVGETPAKGSKGSKRSRR